MFFSSDYMELREFVSEVQMREAFLVREGAGLSQDPGSQGRPVDSFREHSRDMVLLCQARKSVLFVNGPASVPLRVSVAQVAISSSNAFISHN